MVYLSHFQFPHIETEYDFILGPKRTCYDTYYPFQILSRHNLTRLDFEPITILYGGNGSGKTTALNVIAEKLGLTRDTLYNRSNFLKTIRSCAVTRRSLGYRQAAESLPVMMFLILC